MIAEISAVIGALNAVNGVIGTLRDTGNNVNSISKVFSRVTSAATGIAEVEEHVRTGKMILSTNDAMSLAMAKKQIADYERELKDLFLITGNMDTYNSMKRIQAQSIAAAKKRASKAKANKQAKSQELLQVALLLTVVVLVALIGVASFFWVTK